MTVSKTSREAYARVRPKLGPKQIAVYHALLKHPLASNDDIAEMLGWSINTVTPRTNELRALGIVKLGGKKVSRRTGMTVSWMEVTDREGGVV